MNEGPFGLTRELFSILMIAGWLVLGSLVAGWFMRKRRVARVAAFDRTAAQASPVYPYTSSSTQAYTELVGQWHFKSITRWLGFIPVFFAALATLELPLASATPIMAVGLLLFVYSFWRPTLAVQQCNVHPNLSITVGRDGREIPLDLHHYRYARMHPVTNRRSRTPSVLVLDRDSPPGFGALLTSMLFPRVDDRRIVLFYNCWWNGDALIPPSQLDDFIRDACRRAGYEPQFRKPMFGSPAGAPWEIRPL